MAAIFYYYGRRRGVLLPAGTASRITSNGSFRVTPTGDHRIANLPQRRA